MLPREYRYNPDQCGYEPEKPEIVKRLKALVDIGRANTEESIALFEMNKMLDEINELRAENDRLQCDVTANQITREQMLSDIKSMRALIEKYQGALNRVVGQCNKLWAERKYKSLKPHSLKENDSLWDAAEAILKKTKNWLPDNHAGDALGYTNSALR